MAPFQLVGGSFLLQITPRDVGSPMALYQALMMLLGSLNHFSQKVGLVVNNNQVLEGPTTARPTAAQLAQLPNSGVGWSMLDTTLGRPIWWNGTNWVDANGIVATAPGQVGQYVSSAVTTAVNIPNGTETNITTVSLPAGDWDVDGAVYFHATTKGGDVEYRAWTNTAFTEPDGSNGGLAISSTSSGGLTYDLGTATMRLQVATTTTVYLGAYSTFSSGTVNAAGLLRARRFG